MFKCALVTVLTLAIPSCDWLEGSPRHSAKIKHSKPVKQQAEVYDGYDFILHLSLAQIALMAPGADSAIAPHLDILQSYAGSQNNTEQQPVVILTYKSSLEKGKQHLAAPLTLSRTDAKFPALLEVMGALDGADYTLHDIRPVILPVAPPRTLKLSGMGAAETLAQLNAYERALLAEPQSLPPLTAARVQMRLTRFFMENRYRDAAYLSLENAKHALASAGTEGAELTRELGEVEEQLRTQMPLTLAPS